MTVTGAGMQHGVVCRFGDSSVAASVVDDSQAECVSPAGATAGELTLSVATLDGASAHHGSRYEYYDAPRVVRVWPSRGVPTGGTLVSVIGSGYKGGEVKCRFGAVSVGGQAVSWISSTMVACIAPGAAGGQTGPVTVEVSANDGADFTSDGRMYVYAMGATVERLVPSWGLSGTVGQAVTVAGRHFEQSPELSCRFGLEGRTSGLYMSSTAVVCTAPGHGTGSVTVTVSNGAEEQDGMRAAGVRFEYKTQADAWVAEPSLGPTSGGTRVMLTGAALDVGGGGIECEVKCTYDHDEYNSCNLPPTFWNTKARPAFHR